MLTLAYVYSKKEIIMGMNRDSSVTIRIRSEEYAWMDRAAKFEDLSVGSFLRRIILRHLRKNYPKLEKK